MLLEHCTLDSAQRVADTLRRTVENFRFRWQDSPFRVGVTIGLVPIDAASGTVAGVLQAADRACYLAKDAGRNRVHVYREQDTELARRHGEMQWVTRIQQALDRDRFALYAQPILPLCAAAEAGLHCELLVRLVDDNGQILSPGAFMPPPSATTWPCRSTVGWYARRCAG